MDEYIYKQSVIDYLNGYLNSIGECGADSSLFDRGQRRALTNSIQDILAVKAADVEPVKHGRWIIVRKTKLIPTGYMAVVEGHVLTKTGADKPFTMQEANIILLKAHKIVKIPYCSVCGNYGDDEYDKTPYCPYCGAKMDEEMLKNDS